MKNKTKILEQYPILREWKQYGFVMSQLTKRELKRKYARTTMGILWSVLQPLLTMVVMALVFTQMFSRIESYPMYLLTGTTLYTFFSSATNSAMTSLVDNKNLLIKVKFPFAIFPLSRVFTNVVNYLYTFIAYLVLIIVLQVEFSVTMLFAPIIVLFIALFSAGVGFLLSVIYIFFGDVQHLYSVFLTLLMYCSAIFYPIDSVNPIMQSIIIRNPIYNYIVLMRNCMLYQTMPTIDQSLRMVGWALFMFILGAFVFSKNRNKIMQNI